MSLDDRVEQSLKEDVLRLVSVEATVPSDEDIADLSYQTRLFYQGLWTLADKAGRLEDRPKRFKAEIFPYDNLDVTEFLDVLSKPKPASGKPFIHRY